MQEIKGDIWDYLGKVTVCITTNLATRKDGAAVMSRGIKKRFPGIEHVLGHALHLDQNIGVVQIHASPHIFAFPVKYHWRGTGKINLIVRSARQLAYMATIWPDEQFILARPGCGNGQLVWGEVKPMIENILPDNVLVIDYAGPPKNHTVP